MVAPSLLPTPHAGSQEQPGSWADPCLAVCTGLRGLCSGQSPSLFSLGRSARSRGDLPLSRSRQDHFPQICLWLPTPVRAWHWGQSTPLAEAGRQKWAPSLPSLKGMSTKMKSSHTISWPSHSITRWKLVNKCYKGAHHFAAWMLPQTPTVRRLQPF